MLPFWPGIGLDLLDQDPGPMASTIHGVFFDRIAPTSRLRRAIEAPALVVGHPHDPVHPAADAAMLASELPNARFVAAESIVEWRLRPARLDEEVLGFLAEVFAEPAGASREGSDVEGTMNA
jgi:pimeloyl-ACP methyl ester carboxylesterase